MAVAADGGGYKRQSSDDDSSGGEAKVKEEDGDDPFLLVITPQLQVALALHGEDGQRQLLMRCDTPTLSDALALIGRRLRDQNPDQAMALQQELVDLLPFGTDDGVKWDDPQLDIDELDEMLAEL